MAYFWCCWKSVLSNLRHKNVVVQLISSHLWTRDSSPSRRDRLQGPGPSRKRRGCSRRTRTSDRRRKRPCDRSWASASGPARPTIFLENRWHAGYYLYVRSRWPCVVVYQVGKKPVIIYPTITYYWTVPLILDHSYLVRNLTSSKIAETKALEPLKSWTFVSAIFELVDFPTRYEWSKIRGTVQ